MIDHPAGWSWELRASGVMLTRGHARIRYVERSMPLRRISDVVRETAPPSWRSDAALAIERLWTHEHELAVIGAQDGMLAGAPARRVVGMVCVDDWYALIDGVASRGDVATIDASVRELVLADSHERGVRRRRYVYTPPSGWSGLRVPPYHAYWFAPDYPRGGTFLIAFPAQPRRMEADQVASALTAHGATHAVRTSMPLSTDRGLSGHQYDAELPGDLRRTIVVLEDRTYQYPVLVEAPTARMPMANAVLRSVVHSIESLDHRDAREQRSARQSAPVWSID